MARNRDIEQIFEAGRIDRHNLGAHDVDVRRLDGEFRIPMCDEPTAETREFVDKLIDELRTTPLES